MGHCSLSVHSEVGGNIITFEYLMNNEICIFSNTHRHLFFYLIFVSLAAIAMFICEMWEGKKQMTMIALVIVWKPNW